MLLKPRNHSYNFCLYRYWHHSDNVYLFWRAQDQIIINYATWNNWSLFFLFWSQNCDIKVSMGCDLTKIISFQFWVAPSIPLFFTAQILLVLLSDGLLQYIFIYGLFVYLFFNDTCHCIWDSGESHLMFLNLIISAINFYSLIRVTFISSDG